MRKNYPLISLIVAAICINGPVTAQTTDSADAYRGRLRSGMLLSDVVAVLGEPVSRTEMETLRQTRLVYPKGALMFTEGKLLLPETSDLALSAATDPHSRSTSHALRGSASSSSAAKIAKRTKAVKLENVLSEVMHSKAETPSTSLVPRVQNLPSGIPGSASMPGAMPGMAFEPPPNYMQNSMIPRESPDEELDEE